MNIRILLLILLCTGLAQGQNVPFKPRYANHTEFGVLLGRVNYNFGTMENRSDSKVSPALQTFNGLQLTTRLAAGVTLAMDWYKSALISPIAAGLRYDLTHKGPARLFVSADAGYGVSWLHHDPDGYKTKGGLMLNPGFGLKYGKPGNSAFTISLSYKRQEVNVSKPLQWEQTYRLEERIYNRLAFRIGMAF